MAEIMITLYENELNSMVEELSKAKKRGDSSAVVGPICDVDFQIVAQEDDQLKRKKEAAEERGDL